MYDKHTFGKERSSEVLAILLNEIDHYKASKISTMIRDFNSKIKDLLLIKNRESFEYILNVVHRDFVIKCDNFNELYPEKIVSFTKNVLSAKYKEALIKGKSK